MKTEYFDIDRLMTVRSAVASILPIYFVVDKKNTKTLYSLPPDERTYSIRIRGNSVLVNAHRDHDIDVGQITNYPTFDYLMASIIKKTGSLTYISGQEVNNTLEMRFTP